MGPELWSYPAQLWPYVAEADYRRERVSADFAPSRGRSGAPRGARRNRWSLRRRAVAQPRAGGTDVVFGDC